MNTQALKAEVEKLFSEFLQHVHRLIDGQDSAAQAPSAREAPVSGSEGAAAATNDKPPTAAT